MLVKEAAKRRAASIGGIAPLGRRGDGPDRRKILHNRGGAVATASAAADRRYGDFR
jgi:hypothetical protein